MAPFISLYNSFSDPLTILSHPFPSFLSLHYYLSSPLPLGFSFHYSLFLFTNSISIVVSFTYAIIGLRLFLLSVPQIYDCLCLDALVFLYFLLAPLGPLLYRYLSFSVYSAPAKPYTAAASCQ